jgi:endonuclease/exonuclease/phosphatase family metal-dependent hydrolase
MIRYILTVSLLLALCPQLAGQQSTLTIAATGPNPEVKLLTWNIWMMPVWTFQSPSNKSRAAAIADVLSRQDVDIICLEKAFDSGARKVIAQRLRAQYPYIFGPANNGFFSIRINSGVWVLSRIPLTGYHAIKFKKSPNLVEWFSRKGAMSLTGTVDGKTFVLIATHLAGEETPYFTVSHQKVRDAQVQQIVDELLRPLPAVGVPVLIAGDLATPRYTQGASSEQTQAYMDTLRRLEARNGPEYRITLDDDQKVNTLAENNTGRTDELDYILLRDNGATIDGGWERRIFRKDGWDSKLNRPDLSYRYAVIATLTIR